MNERHQFFETRKSGSIDHSAGTLPSDLSSRFFVIRKIGASRSLIVHTQIVVLCDKGTTVTKFTEHRLVYVSLYHVLYSYLELTSTRQCAPA